MSSRMEEMNKNMAGMPELLQFVHQAQMSVPSRVPQGETALEPVVDGEESAGNTHVDGGESVGSAPATVAGQMVDGEKDETGTSTAEMGGPVATSGDEPQGRTGDTSRDGVDENAAVRPPEEKIRGGDEPPASG